MTTSQNGGEEESIYSADVCPSSLFHTTQIVTAAKGSELTIHWTGAGGLNYCNLSAYADWNADGTFNDADELVATYGTKSSSNNGALNDYTLKVLLLTMPLKVLPTFVCALTVLGKVAIMAMARCQQRPRLCEWFMIYL